MEDLQYIIDDNTIVELLGLQSFTTKESAILELVKNAYDAGAKLLTINISPNSLIITDDGRGMNEKEFKESWLHIGKSNKGYDFKDSQGNLRIAAGAKGIGRFALARLGSFVEMNSKKENETSIYWKTNWNNINEIDSNNYLYNGTCFIIKNTRENWNLKQSQKLFEYINRTYIDSYMTVKIFFNEEEILNPNDNVPELKIGKNYSEYIKLSYSAKKYELTCEITNDEFKDEAKNYYSQADFNKHICSFDLIKEFTNKYIEETADDDKSIDKKQAEESLANILLNLGDFTANFYFGMERIISGDEEKFLYKYTNLSGIRNRGITLYRNSFSISSYEGTKDWLELGKRSRKSPASPSHETGNWRVRENQIFGNVLIDKKGNKELKDLANRQGLVENEYYKYFIQIIYLGISEFERYRQNIIRCINKKNKNINSFIESRISDSLIENPSMISSLDDNQKEKLISELSKFKEQEDVFNTKEKDYKYDVRILNTLATNGLHASSIAHELDNDRDSLITTCDNIIVSLKKYKMWNTLQLKEYTAIGNRNIPRLLEKNNENNRKICNFIDTILKSMEKRQYNPCELNVNEILTKIVNKWEEENKHLKIKLLISKDLTFHCSEDIFNTIFDNLILNSIQQNSDKNLLTIRISIVFDNNQLFVDYSDNGIGLHEKYKKNPRRILEAMETSRPNGHGLGMWIINNTLSITGGEIKDIQLPPGFTINFTIGEDL